MTHICSMFVVLLFIGRIPYNISQFECGSNCLCFDDMVDCSRQHLRGMPTFSEFITLSTQKLLLRHMPDLDLTTWDCTQWINLKELNLKGK